MVFKSVTTDRLRQHASEGKGALTLSGTPSSCQTFIISGVASEIKRPLFILTPTAEDALKFYEDLQFFLPHMSQKILHFPAWEPHPYEQYSPHPEQMAQRVAALFKLLVPDSETLIVTPLSAILQRVIPREVLLDACEFFRKNADMDREGVVRKLQGSGYLKVPTVEDMGEFSIRGGIVDIYSPAHPHPFRMELLGDKIETIRFFDPSTQKSVIEAKEAVAIPTREVLFKPSSIERACDLIKGRGDEAGVKKSERDRWIQSVQNGTYFPGIDYLLPLFYERLETFFDYLPDRTLLVFSNESRFAREQTDFYTEALEDKKSSAVHGHLVTEIEEMYLSEQEISEVLSTPKRICFEEFKLVPGAISLPIEVKTHETLISEIRRHKPTDQELLKPLVDHIRQWRRSGYGVVVICHTVNQGKRLASLLDPYKIQVTELSNPFASGTKLFQAGSDEIWWTVGSISQGFEYPEAGVILISEEEIFGQKAKRKAAVPSRFQGALVSSLSELEIGDYVVHVDHGIGLYKGLHPLAVEGTKSDFLLLEYQDQDRLYVPIYRLNAVQKYVGSAASGIALSKLGSQIWAKTKGKVSEAVREMALELLQISATRQLQQGFRFSPRDYLFQEFEATFSFEETPDQLRAINEVLEDMTSEKPMDRLVCGDVGYGKTEVALRAAFKAVTDGKQVGFLAPTTLLAHQHYLTFKERFAHFPVKVDVVSRLRNAKEVKKTLEETSQGDVDILIGTHRLLSADVQFKDLGLLMIDEEQRFGVKHKEKLKRLRASVDILTLSATPIPRTLHMALMGLRDMSIIMTPPQDRHSVRTFVARFGEEVIQEAIAQELARGGQVFFVHNWIQSIEKITEYVKKTVPEAKVAYAHGQMDENKLEEIMFKFINKEFDVLVCTTIIGAGIDIPNANTIIIDRADTFGLSLLYQLRGRVGRSMRRAFAYLLIPSEGSLEPSAERRLKVLQSCTELGSGFKVATYDLEIRGGGNILGPQQSGQISAVGFELYTDLLQEVMDDLLGKPRKVSLDPEINLKANAYIPEEYIPDIRERLGFYKKLASVETEDQFSDIELEMRDRFGPVPPAMLELFELMLLKFYLKELRVKILDGGKKRLQYSLLDPPAEWVEKLLQLINKEPKKYALHPAGKFVVQVDTEGLPGAMEQTRKLLRWVQGGARSEGLHG